MSAVRPKAPGPSGGHAGAAKARVHDGRSTVRIVVKLKIMLMLMVLVLVLVLVLVMTTAAAVTVGNQALITMPANVSIDHGHDDPTKGGWIGAAGGNNGSLARHRVGRRRLACSAMAWGQS